jgi:integrase
MQLFKIYSPLGKFHDADSRTSAGESLIRDYADKLRHGWSPFTDESRVIYNDSLEYDHISRIYGKQRMDNRSIRFWASKYVDSLNGSLDADGTIPTYKSKLRIFSLWIDKHQEGNDATAVTNRTVVDFFRWLIDDQNRSAKTIHDYRYILAGLFEWLIAQKIFISNPVHDLPVCTRICDQAPSPIHRFDIETFKEGMKHDPQLWLAAQFQYYCALRPGRELRLLKIKNIDFACGLVTVMRSEAKTKITRTVVIPQQFLVSLRNEFGLMSFPSDYYVFGNKGIPGPDHLGKNNLRYRFNAIRKKLGMPDFYKFYSWKHTGAVQASLSGIPDSHIQRQLGHTSLATTEKYLRKMTGFQSDFLKNQYPEI